MSKKVEKAFDTWIVKFGIVAMWGMTILFTLTMTNSETILHIILIWGSLLFATYGLRTLMLAERQQRLHAEASLTRTG